MESNEQTELTSKLEKGSRDREQADNSGGGVEGSRKKEKSWTWTSV